MAEDLLYHIPATRWVTGTIARLLLTGREDPQTWNACWYDEYTALGGNTSSGKKPCPRSAARGLWLLGRLRDGKRPLLSWSTAEVCQRLGKNAAYASITADLLATNPGQAVSDLLPQVQHEFTRCTGAPVGSVRDEVRLVAALAHSQQLV